MAEKFTIEDAQLIWLNFRGEAGQFNNAGDRNFALRLHEEDALRLQEQGWNVKMKEGREEGDPAWGALTVKVKFGGRPPLVYMITSRGRSLLGEDLIGVLDAVDIKSVDLIVNPYNWSVQGSQGVTAYLEKMFVTIHEDTLDLKYAQYDDAPME